MKKDKLITILETTQRPLLADGAMGTMLHASGIGFDGCFDSLNVEDPSRVAAVHRAYIDAGAQIIQTNTFGANRYKLGDHGFAHRVEEINRAGVELAKRVVLASYKDVLVAGDIGPLGVRLAPFGRIQHTEAFEVFREQAQTQIESGVDLVIIETMTDLFEICLAVRAVRSVSDVPIIASMTFTRDDRTLLGDNPVKVAETLRQDNVEVIGINCSGGPSQICRILRQMRSSTPDAYFSVMPNAGWPERIGGRIKYPANPDYFGDFVLEFSKAGANIIGGCCGTTPDHIASMRTVLDRTPTEELQRDTMEAINLGSRAEISISEKSRLAQKLETGHFVIAVEIEPPRGLRPEKTMAGVSVIAESGADVINVADSPMARMRMSPWAVCQLIRDQVGIDTTLHFPTRGRNLLRVQGDLLAAHAIGVRNVFVVMGDPTEIGDYPEAMDNYDLVPSGLIRLIKHGFNTGVDLAGEDIGQPTAFFVGCALNMASENFLQEAKVFRKKIQAGADFAISQPVYETGKCVEFLNRYEREYGRIQIPILAGVMPLMNSRHASFLHNEVPGIQIPDSVRRRLDQAGDQSPQEGIRIALELIDTVRDWAGGIYLMPQFRRYDLAAELIESIKTN